MGVDVKKFSEIGKDQFDALYRISKLLNSVTYRDSLLSQALDLVVDVTRAERGLFVRYDVKTDTFNIIGARNVRGEDVTDLSQFSSGILKRVIENKEPCLYHDVQSDPNVSQFTSVQIQKIKSVIGVPIFRDNNIWGVILADSRENRAEFTEENLHFLKFFANLVSLALDRILHMEALQDENEILRNQVPTIPDLIGDSGAMRQLASLVNKVAPTDATVLLQGESGTGKDLVAKAIHKASLRKNNPFLAQFCGAIPDTLLESELFGYKKGAFTGATSDKKGLFEIASEGTFFLDEIADISMALQAKLLRVLQNQEIIRLGDTQVKKINVRIIAATNQDLVQKTREGAFRQDLFYRLNVFPITIPPLRERRDDIPLLAEHFLNKYASKKIRLHADALKKLVNYSWPGNVRQLENVIRRGIILCGNGVLKMEHIILEEEGDDNIFDGTLEQVTQILLTKRLREFNNNRTLTAKSLGVSVRWVQLKIQEMKNQGTQDI